MRGLRALLVGVVVMGAVIFVGTAFLVSVVVKRATHPTAVAGAQLAIAPEASAVALDQPPGTRILSVVRQSDTLLAITLGGGGPDRLLIWDIAAGRVVARLSLAR